MNGQPTWNPAKDWQVSYVPHGIDPNMFKPVDVPADFKKSLFGDAEYDFVLYWSNRNIRRKQPVDVVLAFDKFVRELPEEKRSKVCLLMHTQPVDENGTDLPTTIKHCCSPDTKIIFTPTRYPEQQLNWLCNLADVTINIASNEGFGLATAESVMAGTPIIVNVTGGLQDQCGFKMKGDAEYLTADDYIKIGSLHDKAEYEKAVTWGEWVTPIWPVRSTAGSIPTPYIFDDRIDYAEIVPAIDKWYRMTREERKAAGMKGREWMVGEGNLSLEYMCKSLSDGMEAGFANWKPRKKYQLFELV
jgi:glycosyltransferase involved in cell wall biosynthesis